MLISQYVLDPSVRSPEFTGPRQLYLESKIGSDVEVADACDWIARIWRDSSSHHTFAQIVLKVCISETIFLAWTDDNESSPEIHPIRDIP